MEQKQPEATNPRQIVLIGTSSSGRWALMRAWRGEEYDPQQDEGDYHFDVPYDPVTVDGVTVTFLSPFWPGLNDSNTEERQQSWARLTYDHMEGCMLVYSVEGDRYTFEEWLPMHYRWFLAHSVRPAVVVATRCEHEPGEWKVTSEEGKKFAESLGLLFFEVSVKQNRNVMEPLKALVRQVKDAPSAQQQPTKKGRCIVC